VTTSITGVKFGFVFSAKSDNFDVFGHFVFGLCFHFLLSAAQVFGLNCISADHKAKLNFKIQSNLNTAVAFL